ncbi:LuxR C-terminal-related transcriptional regulator [Gordonibacter massiliensis (ex Traore et al. 2017)]|uniref:LuxR family transcriptional regulator n=1 Tax=Gordonibacter massiliensis (ex Traore et al. 2017) TaxID=1841863 RepID=A0A842JHB7_9ACTN|nr:LuxR C-terminal-related transcriptional regulator [Gordonibacter massiliensis (ex Traore et al. 2017)]MBC2889881.1 LuxR family transcriptional regulator [Gordonibacter massiliensis (ex Traore et al. 2017)]
MVDARRAEREDWMSPLAEQWPYLRFLGLGAWWAWIWLCYNSIEITRMFPADQQPTYVLQMYLFSTLGIAGSMFTAAVAWKRMTRLIDKRPFVIGFGAFAGLSTILLGFSVVMGAGVFFVLAAVFTGIGTSMLCLKVGRLYGSVSLGDSLTAGGISLLLAALLYFVGVGIPAEWRLFYLAALPVASGLLLSIGSIDPFPSAVSGTGEGRGRGPVQRLYRKLVAASALVALTAGIGKGISSTLADNALFAHEGTVIVFCIGVAAVLITYVVNRGDVVRGARQAYSALMVLGMAMMLGTCFGLDIAYLSVGKEALWLVFSCFMAYLAFRYDLSPVRVFGIGQGAYFLASTAGWALGAAIAPSYGEGMVRMGVGVALAFLVIIVLVYVFPENDLKRIMAWSVDGDAVDARRERHGGEQATADPQELASPVAPDAPRQPSTARAADPRFGLSARELEILDLFAQGRSANWIADHLVISKNTVRSHLRAIYTKLDVHTRQELLDFLAGSSL